MRRRLPPRRQHRGFLLVGLLALLVAGVLVFAVTVFGPEAVKARRTQKTEAALAEARDALIGFAVTYRDSHPGQGFGYLPCPDADNDGVADLTCGTKNVTTVGRLPWKTLRISDLRDGDGECLWYIVSGHFKYNPKTDEMNWDTVSQIQLNDADGNTLAAAGQHDSPVAVIVATGSPLSGENRTPLGTTTCGGNVNPSAYLEGLTINLTAEDEEDSSTFSVVTFGTALSVLAGTNNDHGITILSSDIFNQVQKRSDFKNDIDTRLLASLSGCLNGSGLPAASGSKGIEGVLTTCGASAGTLNRVIQDNWKQNLLYARPGGTITVNGDPACTGVLAFSGSRDATQVRRNAAERNSLGMYLTASNFAAFPDGVSGGASFDPLQGDQDLFVCLSPSGPITVSFDNDIAKFNEPEGNGLSIDLISNPDHPTVDIEPSGGITGSCLWYPSAIPLNGRAVRVFFRSQFALTDQFALAVPSDSEDEGYGFTFQIVSNAMSSAPDRCGLTSNMGALSSHSSWGNQSVIFETDVHFRSSDNDPSANHVAIMLNGDLEHSSTPTTACDGTQSGCALTPANTLEDSPSPMEHNHRIEILAGCNSTCTTCNPASPAGSNARLRLWLDCTGYGCSDLTSDFLEASVAQRCISLPPEIDQFYFGFTGGFFNSQGVRIWDFNLRSEIP